MIIFRARLKFIRNHYKLTQDEMAKKLEVPTITYRQWETGKRIPNIESLCNICKVFNVSADYMLGICDSFESFVE